VVGIVGVECGRCGEKCTDPVIGSRCRTCTNEYNRENYAKNREQRCKQIRERDPEARWAYNIGRWYGLSAEEYYSMLEDQNDCCAICGSSSPGNRRIKKFPIDHIAGTKIVRGLLCSQCNQMIGLAKHDIEVLRHAIAYLERTS